MNFEIKNFYIKFEKLDLKFGISFEKLNLKFRTLV